MSRLRPQLPLYLERPSLQEALRSGVSFPRPLRPRCATIAPRPPRPGTRCTAASVPCGPGVLSTRVSGTCVPARTEHPPASRACREHRAEHRGPAYLCNSGQSRRWGSGGGAATTAGEEDRFSPYSHPASVTRAGSFIMSPGPNPCAGVWPVVLTCDARRG